MDFMTEMNINNIRLIIFDPGNVVFEVNHQKIFHHWADVTSLPEEFFADHRVPEKIFHQFERGEITPEEFHKVLITYKEVDLSFEDFSEGWNAIYGEAYLEVHNALQKLSDKVFLVALTNTNELHRKVWIHKYAMTLKYFNKLFISSQLGFRKPEDRAFKYVLEECKVTPREALFFDDVIENITKANDLGIHAVQVSKPSDITRELQQCGFNI
jgi:putative hydrolase of the HAD superfamily